MATEQSITGAVTQVERTFHIDRLTPLGGAYVIRIHRETITYLDGAAIARREEEFVDQVTATMQRACTRDYLAACQRAKVPTDLMVAEAAWADALVAEIRVERAAAAAAQAAGENG